MNYDEKEKKLLTGTLIKPEIESLLTELSNILDEQGIKAYVVGGLVRDLLLGRDTVDVDVAIAADALEVAPGVATALGGKYVLLDNINRIGRVVLVNRESPLPGRQWLLDFATYEGSITQDLERRDFTINAMAVDLGQFGKGLHDFQIVDPGNGWDDLHRGVVRVVGRTAFQADAVRLLRAVRLAAELGFSIEKETEALIRRFSDLINGVAGERIREELLRLLAIPSAGSFLTYLDELGLLTAIFPEIAPARGVEQPKEHYWDVLNHSLNTVITVDFLLGQGSWEYAGEEVMAAVPWSDVLAQHFSREVSAGSTRRSLLKLAALLHDIAKPQTRAMDAGGRMRFLGHAKEGAAQVVNMLERLRFSRKEIELVETGVRHHLRPGQMSQNELPTRRAIYRYFRDTGEAGIDILFLSLADHLATRGPHLDLSHWRQHARMVEYVLSQHFQGESVAHPPKLVDGHDIMNIFGINPGPRIGEILEAVREAQATGELTTRQEALLFVEKLISLALPSKGENG